MSRGLTLAALAACVWLLAQPTASGDDPPATVTDREAQSMVTKAPESVEAWDTRRPLLLGWLRGRLAEAPAGQGDWSVGDQVERDGCLSITLRFGEKVCGRLLVPSAHVGRGPAVIHFAESGRDESAGVHFARAGYIVMVVHDIGVVTDSAEQAPSSETPAAIWQATTHADLKAVQFLLARREVDPDRVAVLGVGAEARRTWWAAALDDRLAAVVSLGTPESGTLEDQVMLSLVAPRPHRLALDTRRVRERGPAYRHWVAGPQDVYQWCEVPSLLSTKLGTGFSLDADSPAWEDTLTWLKDEL